LDKPDVFVGIDVGRHHHQCSFVDGERKPIAKTLRIREDRDGFQALKLEMDNIVQKKDEVRFHIGLEATGHYHQNLTAFLQAIDDLDVEVTCINPVQTKRFIQMQMLREQNDKVDARAIAEYMCVQRPAPTPRKRSDMQPLRDLSRLRCQLITQRTASLNQLHAILDHVFPEFEQIFTDVKSEPLAWTLLSRYPCPQNLITAKTSQLMSVQAKKGGGYLGKERALQLKKFAKQTVGSSRGEVYAFQVKILVQNVKSLQQQIEETDKAIENSMQALELPPWKTIPNVGILTMATLLGDVGDPRLFGSAKKFASFLGLTPRGKQSGSSINRKGHISKCGPSHARQKLYMCVISALSTKKNPLIIEIYNRLVSKGKPKNVAIVACMNHLARIIYGVFKSNHPFNPEYQGLKSGLGRPQNGNLATMPGVLLPRPLGNITAT
jgi:transposase